MVLGSCQEDMAVCFLPSGFCVVSAFFFFDRIGLGLASQALPCFGGRKKQRKKGHSLSLSMSMCCMRAAVEKDAHAHAHAPGWDGMGSGISLGIGGSPLAVHDV